MAAGNSDSREVIDLTVELESLEERQARRLANRLAASESRARKHVVIDLTSEEAVECAVQVVRLEGLLGFYKGLVPNLLRVVPSSTITFVTTLPALRRE